MRTTTFRHGLATLILCILFACGGGGGEDEPGAGGNAGSTGNSGTTQPGGGTSGGGASSGNTAPIANLGAAQPALVGATIALYGYLSQDAENDPLAYSWVLSTRPAGSAAALAGATTARPSLVPDAAGTYVATLTVNDGKVDSAPASLTITVLPVAGLAILLDQPEPLSDTVKLSLTLPTLDAKVTWYVDLERLQDSNGATATYYAGAAPNGSHLVSAVVEISDTNHLEVRRTVTVSHPTVFLQAYQPSAVNGMINVDVKASSTYGVTRVTASFDGVSLGSLSAPNACHVGCTGAEINVFRFTVDGNNVAAGNHTMVITGVDAAGSVRQVGVSVPVLHAPTLNISSPYDGAFVSGSLKVSGSYVSDSQGLVTVTATLGNVKILQTTDPSFSIDYDLAGIPAGSYSLVLRAVDSQQISTVLNWTVAIAPSGAQTPAPLFSIGATGNLLASEGDLLLYSAADQSLRLRNTAGGSEVVLQGGALANPRRWQVSGGRAYVLAKGDDCASNSACVYEWQIDGTRANLTDGNPWAGNSNQEYPVARDGFVLWCNDAAGSGLTLYNVASRAYTHVLAPPGISQVGNTDFDFAMVGGVVHVFYWVKNGSIFEIYRWRSDTKSSTPLSTPGQSSTYVRTDGVRVAWTQKQAASTGVDTLLVQPFAGGAVSVLSSAMTTFRLRDGALAWAEANVVKATAAAGGTVTLGSASLVSTSGGFVVYDQAGKTYSWKAATGQSSLVVETATGQKVANGNKLYFVLGGLQLVYKLTLN